MATTCFSQPPEFLTFEGPPAATQHPPRLNQPLRFAARSVKVDNPTNQWIRLTPDDIFIPPGVWGTIVNLLEPRQTAAAEWTAPYGTQMGPDLPVALGVAPVGSLNVIQKAWLTYYADELLPQAGVFAPSQPEQTNVYSAATNVGASFTPRIPVPSRTSSLILVFGHACTAITISGLTRAWDFDGPVLAGVPIRVPIDISATPGSTGVQINYTDPGPSAGSLQVWAQAGPVPPGPYPPKLGPQISNLSMSVTMASDQAAIPVDVSDRAGRLLGIIDSITAAVDVSDRAARLLGQISAASGATFDVSDRSARLLGQVSPASGATWDVSDRIARLVGIIALADPTGAIIASVGSGDADASGIGNSVAAKAFLRAYNNTNYDRVRDGAQAVLIAESSKGALLVAPPGSWAINNLPAVSTRATISRAAGAAGVSHVCTGLSFGFSATTPLGAIVTVTINLRDGATGAGTVLWAWQFTLPAAVISPFQLSLSGLNFVGSAATAMTLEFGALVTNLLEFVTLSGYDAAP